MSNRFKPKFNIRKGDTVVVIAGDRPFELFEQAPDIWPECEKASRRPIGGGALR